MRNQRNQSYDPQPDLVNLQEPAHENYQIVTRFIPSLLRLYGLTVAVFTRFHFGRNYITAHTNAFLGVLIMTGGMGAMLLLFVFAGFFNQSDSGLPLGVFLASAWMLTMLHRAIAFFRAMRKGPEAGMFPGKPWIGLILPVDRRLIYIVIEPALIFAVGFALSRVNWPLGLWMMSASAVLAIFGFVDMKNYLFSVLDARDAGSEGEIFTNEVTHGMNPGGVQSGAPPRFGVRVNKAR